MCGIPGPHTSQRDHLLRELTYGRTDGHTRADVVIDVPFDVGLTAYLLGRGGAGQISRVVLGGLIF